MQYTTVLLSLLAATGMTAPTKRALPTGGLEVRLEAETFFLQVPMPADVAQRKFLGDRFADVKFKSIEVLAGGVDKPRCQVKSREGGFEIIAKRNANIDTTFSDAGKGKWTFQDGAIAIGDIVCDPKFEANNLNVNNFVPTATDAATESTSESPAASVSAVVEAPVAGEPLRI